ncbi:MAG TPA: NAD(P)-dependent oxidoreductase [Nitrospirota bacterium]|nr:NAD(P)-dependent oxidoreductase [Nitrospirota bacterium]
MEILIVGGAGDVGRHLTDDFIQAGHTVRILDLVPRNQQLMTNPGIAYYQGNLTDKTLVTEVVRGSDVIVHLAWSFADDPHTIFSTDIQGTANLLDAAAASSGVRSFIYASTAVVYGRAIHHPVTERHPCLIEDARKPFYALGKYVAEKLCLLYFKERGLPISIIRFWWAFGGNIGGRHLRDLIKTSLGNKSLAMVRGAGGSFVTMNDLASAMRLIMQSTTAVGQTYNVGSLFLSWEEIGAMLIELVKSSSTIQLVPSDQWQGPAFLNEVWDLSWDKLGNELGYRCQYSETEARIQFRAALKSCIASL